MGAEASGFLKASPPPRNLRFFTCSDRRVSGRASPSACAALDEILVKLRASRSEQQGSAVARGVGAAGRWNVASVGPGPRGGWGGSGDRIRAWACVRIVFRRPRRDDSSGAGPRAEGWGLMVGGKGDSGGDIVPRAH